MGTSENGASGSGGCFSGFLRVLLCRTKLQTHPAGESPEERMKAPSREQDREEMKSMKPVSMVAAPGVVARLMGLDSLPLDTERIASKGRHGFLDASVRRCRSVNFMEYMLELDISRNSRKDEGLHRRVKTSVSFREVPPLLSHHEQDLLRIYLKDQVNGIGNEKPEMAVNHRKPKPTGKDSSIAGNNHRRDASRIRLEIQARKAERKEVSFSSIGSSQKQKPVSKSKAKRTMSKPVKEKELLEESKFMKKIKKKKTNLRDEEESVFSGEGCSPVSVLDNITVDSPVHEAETIFADDSDSTNLSSKEKVKFNDSVDIHEDYFIEKLTDDEAEASNWGTKGTLEKLCSELEDVLFKTLLSEIVQELGDSGEAIT